MNDKDWVCPQHNQDEWKCYKTGNGEYTFEFHQPKDVYDAFSVKEEPKYTLKRCMNCQCHYKDNPTDEIDECPIYGNPLKGYGFK